MGELKECRGQGNNHKHTRRMKEKQRCPLYGGVFNMMRVDQNKMR